MSSDRRKPSTVGTTSQPTSNRNENGTGKKFSNTTKRCQGSEGKFSEDSLQDDEELNMMDEIGMAFEKAIDSKFAKMEQRIIRMEKKRDKVYNIVTSKGNGDKYSDESVYRNLLYLIENNSKEFKQNANRL